MDEIVGARAVVTGGAGFIGSHLVDALLAAGMERVAVVDTFFLGKEGNLAQARERHGDALQVYREDAADLGAMSEVCRRERPDLVFNLATKALLYSFFNPAGAFTVNVDVAMTLVELLRGGAYSRLVHLSSSEVYGSARRPQMDEDHPLLAETSYAAGKAAADLLLAAYVKMFDLDIVTVRPFNNYGPRQNEGAFAAVIPLTLRRLRSGLPPLVEGDGKQTRDFIYVSDTVDVTLRLAMSDLAMGKTLNLGSGVETPVGEIIETICAIAGYNGPVIHAPARVADVRRHRADVTRLESLLGPLPLTGLREGLERTFVWHESIPGARV